MANGHNSCLDLTNGIPNMFWRFLKWISCKHRGMPHGPQERSSWFFSTWNRGQMTFNDMFWCQDLTKIKCWCYFRLIAAVGTVSAGRNQQHYWPPVERGPFSAGWYTLLWSFFSIPHFGCTAELVDVCDIAIVIVKFCVGILKFFDSVVFCINLLKECFSHQNSGLRLFK